MVKPRSKRLDEIAFERGWAETPERAKALVMAGRVRVDGATVHQPFQLIGMADRVELAPLSQYVSRGGEKLGPALLEFGIAVEGRICADVGASTGGFTDVLLQRGALLVYAVDVGRGQLAWRLRQDRRVVVMEGVNARHLEGFPEPVGLFTVDLSFIGLEQVLPRLRQISSRAELVVLFKPQFQLPRAQVERGGVVRDAALVEQALEEFAEWCVRNGFQPRGRLPSALPGRAGNQEYLFWLQAEAEA
ncbi:MAG: TlyA family RNA methyltransferase [Candidatus Dormibacteraceae bacterium]